MSMDPTDSSYHPTFRAYIMCYVNHDGQITQARIASSDTLRVELNKGTWLQWGGNGFEARTYGEAREIAEHVIDTIPALKAIFDKFGPKDTA